MQIRVNGTGWPTWNFSERQRGPVVPAGTYEVVEKNTPSARPAIVLSNPTAVMAEKGDMIGQDKENLLDAIKTGAANFELIA